jgi:hypothetical protein
MASPVRLPTDATEGRREGAPATLPETDTATRGVWGRIRRLPLCARPSENAPTCIAVTCAKGTDRDKPTGGPCRRLGRALEGGETPDA